MSALRLRHETSAPRVDAQSSSSHTEIGGWFSVFDSNAKIDFWNSDWFTLEIHEGDFPWVFGKGSKLSLVISTLEALAVLVSLKLY